MLNSLVICRSRYNALRHNPLELIILLNLLAIAEEDGTYTIKKNYYQRDADPENVTQEQFDEILTRYK